MLVKVPRKEKQQVTDDLKEVFHRDQAHPRQAWDQVVQKHQKKYPAFARVKNIDAYFTFLAYDKAIHSMIRTTNWIERLKRNFRRVTKMRAGSLTETAALTLLGAAAQNIKAYHHPHSSAKTRK